MHYLDEGKGQPLLFVHGNPTWSFYWRKLVTDLSKDYRCIAPDHIGCGLSEKPQNWSYRLNDHIDNLVYLINTLDLRVVTLLVHDWGGAIGLGAALRLPDRIKRLVIFNTGVFPGPIPWEIRLCRWPVIGDVAIRRFNGFVKVGLMRAPGDPEKFKGSVEAGYLAPYDSYENRIANLRFVQDIPLEPGHPSRRLFLDIGENCRALSNRPTLILWGEKDFCFTSHYRTGFQMRFPDAEVRTFPEVGHWVADEGHTEILPILRSWLERHPVDERSTPAPALGRTI
jgi:haloalkane dehalogenase